MEGIYIKPDSSPWVEREPDRFDRLEESVTDAILHNYAPSGTIPNKKMAEQACMGILTGTKALTNRGYSMYLNVQFPRIWAKNGKPDMKNKDFLEKICGPLSAQVK